MLHKGWTRCQGHAKRRHEPVVLDGLISLFDTESIAAVDKGDVDKGDSDGTEARVAEADAVESGKLADLAKRSFYKVLELEPVDASRRASGEIRGDDASS